MKIVTVFRPGGDYSIKHVRWIHKQLPKHVEALCFSDIAIPGVETIPFKYDWPGWWSKIEIFNPNAIDDAVFYLDLDTVIVGDITDILRNKHTALCADFYYPEKTKNSSIMYIPQEMKSRVWDTFLRFPDMFMKAHANGGDQTFITALLPEANTWQQLFPGQVVSYKKHVVKKHRKLEHATGNGNLPQNARIVCFHGKPRPWDANEPWIPDLG
jgi:hypothetical protein